MMPPYAACRHFDADTGFQLLSDIFCFRVAVCAASSVLIIDFHYFHISPFAAFDYFIDID
jgi:hypothetical protein